MSKIQLRGTTEADLDFVLAVESAEENYPFVGQWTRAQHLATLSNGDMSHFIIEEMETGKAVGYVMLAGIDSPDQNLEFKRMAITVKDKGYGRAALRLIKRLAFEEHNAHRLWLDVVAFNPRARHLYETEGFVIEGTLRECLKYGDKFESLIVMSILQSEYKSFILE